MKAKEQQQATVLNQVERRELTGQQAAVLVGLSLRRVRRLLARYRGEEGNPDPKIMQVLDEVAMSSMGLLIYVKRWSLTLVSPRQCL